MTDLSSSYELVPLGFSGFSSKKRSGTQMNRCIPLLLLFLPLYTLAQSTDAEFAPLLKVRKIAEVEKLANERIALTHKSVI